MRGSHAENQVATMKRTKSVSKRPRFRDTEFARLLAIRMLQ